MKRNLAFFSPRAWRGVLFGVQKFLPDHTFSMISSWFLLHLVAPFVVLSLTFCLQGSSSASASLSAGEYLSGRSLVNCVERAAIATLICPLCIFKTFETAPHAKMIIDRIYMWKKLRIEADNEELLWLNQKIASGDAVRTSGFDVYFPPESESKLKDDDNDKVQQQALIFIPGAFVDHTSYSTIASRIASEGNMVVVVMSLEPFRMAGEYLLEWREVQNVIYSATKLWKRHCKNNNNNNHTSSDLEWSLLGHSFGGYGAMRLAPAMVDYQRRRRKKRGEREHEMGNPHRQPRGMKVVMWGAGSFPNYVTDLSDRSDIVVLVVLGSNDNICKFETKEDLQFFASKLPTNRQGLAAVTTRLPRRGGITFIKGGNHNQFANYPGLDLVNGSPGITREEQQKQVVKATLDFLRC